MVPFASITACHLSNVYFVKVLPILECLPLLEYLWLGRTTLKMQEDTNSVSLPATLKYLRCYVYSEPAVPFGRRMFDSIKTLVVVDITSQPNQSTIRMRHGNYQGPVFYQSGAWTRWWENAKRAVELAEVRREAMDPAYDLLPKFLQNDDHGVRVRMKEQILALTVLEGFGWKRYLCQILLIL
ncbi:hypothetical protein EYR36_009999 [Pleurotus pulmonarius]|nr:hypothetical protein EYR36_009999 [Pleurotus pulmonarius]